MIQFQTEYEDGAQFAAWLEEIHTYCSNNGLERNARLFRVLTESRDLTRVAPVLAAIRARFPDALWAGTSVNGSIVRGTFAQKPVAVTATLYECPDTRVEVAQLPMTYDTQEATAETLLSILALRPWVKAVEMMTTISGVNLPGFCSHISAMPEDIAFYGGGALALDVPDGNSGDTVVFSSASDLSTHSVVFVLQGGPQLHVHARAVTGWRRLGQRFEVTSARNNVLKELNGVPALELYRHYLHIPQDEHFYEMAVVFPFCFEEDGAPFLRVPVAYLEDGSLILGADIKEHTVGNIAYGDLAHIQEHVNESLKALADFAPQTIQLFSCAARQFYWGPELNRETLPFQSLASTSGYYTAGEFLRARHDVLLHNVTLVIAALREGEAAPVAPSRMEGEGFSRPIMINNCLTSFINVASEELEQVNRKLSHMAVTDGLTGLCNRSEIERRIHRALEEYQRAPEGRRAPVAVMMDLDHFKDVNDTHGHQEGDEVLRQLAGVFTRIAERSEADVSVGRWGGEEFMLLIQGMDLKQAGAFADEVRAAFTAIRFPASGSHTLSAGVAQATLRDTGDTLTGRADKGLYLAKERGRNQSVVVTSA